MSGATRRMGIALLALIGLFISLYLLLFKLGVYSELVCGAGGTCDLVQASPYARFLGVPVAGWGTLWYAAVFLVALLGLRARPGTGRWPDRRLLLLSSGGLAFSAYLTFVELFLLHAICRWCVASALLTLLIFGLTLPWSRSSVRL